MTKQTVSFYTQGCRLNQSETAILERSFEASQFEIVPFGQPSDLVVINTCTVTENGDSDTRRLIHKINRVQTDSKIALVGCQAQILKEALLAYPNVKWVIGNAQKYDLPSIVKTTWSQKNPLVQTPKPNRESFTVPLAGIDRHHTRANIKIQDGCDFYCAFCVIPFARGPARSRQFDDIFKEVDLLVAAGHKEIVVTGINLGTYSHDDHSFYDVIHMMTTVPNLHRIRISSIEPTTIPHPILSLMHTPHSRLCRHLHIPLQSGSDPILEAMNRHYDTATYKEFILKADSEIPDICLGTDVIVGFPGETDALFDATLSFLQHLPLAYIHVFSYSERQMARSKKLDGQVPSDTIARRSLILRQLSHQKKYQFCTNQLGKTEMVLFEQQKNGLWSGLTDHYVRVFVKSDHPLSNQIVPVKLSHIHPKGQAILGDLV